MKSTTEAKDPKVQSRAIVILILSTLLMIASSFSLFKFMPIMTFFLEFYNIEMAAMSSVMSVFTWMLIITAIPVGLFLSRFPAKYTGAIAAGCIIVGNIISLIAGSLVALIIGRMVEAIGYAMLQVLTNCLVTSTFKDSKLRGTMVGIVGVGLMAGQAIYLNVAPRIATQSGLAGVYWMIIITVTVLALLWLIFIKKDSTVEAISAVQKMEKSERRRLRLSAFKSRDLWLIAVAYAVLRMGIATAGQYVPAYLTTVRGIDTIAASGMTSIATTLGIIMMVLTGVICDALKTRRKVQIISSFTIIIAWFLLMKLPLDSLIIFFIVYGTLPRTYTTTTYSSYPDIFDDPTVIPVAHSTVQFVGNVIGAIATIVFGFIIQYAGYDMLWYTCMALGAIGGICWIFAKKIH
ncbi:MAG: CynX/NimT family MFS transporter [Saccharofermentanales bacterium]